MGESLSCWFFCKDGVGKAQEIAEGAVRCLNLETEMEPRMNPNSHGESKTDGY